MSRAGTSAIQTWPYREVWVVDFEFNGGPGNAPTPVCMVAHEVRSGCTLRMWADELARGCPIPVGRDVLYVAYFASAELGCHLALGWPLPVDVLDLYAEFRCMTNSPGQQVRSLIDAMGYFGLGQQALLAKDDMRQLILRGGPWSEAERRAIIDYCEADVTATRELLGAMSQSIDLDRSLFRGRYMAAVARMEHVGVPVDVGVLATLKESWSAIQHRVIERMDAPYQVYEGITFKRRRFESWLKARAIAWPRLEKGGLNLADDTFKDMARAHPSLGPLRELRSTMAQMRSLRLQVGDDGRARTMLSPFASITGRNQPSTTKFIFGPATWLRGLIKPSQGRAIAYVDWEQQEFGIGAALSGDGQMGDAYRSGDPYLTFAKQAGAVPADATKSSHKAERELFKCCALGVQYGMGEESLAQRIGRPVIEARKLLLLHRQTYSKFWAWSDRVVNQALLKRYLVTTFGWRLRVGKSPNERSLRNFPMQANGAEMLRFACALAGEAGIRVCAPVHDAILIEAPLSDIDQAVARMQTVMARASALVLNGFELRTDAKVIRYPERYMDDRGREMWDTVAGLLNEATEVGLAA